MTITNANRKAGPFLGNGVTTAFPFNYKVFKKEDVTVTKTDTNGVDSVLVLDSDYSVSLNSNQDNNPGGTVTYPAIGSPLSNLLTGEKLTLTGGLAYTQPTDLPNPGPFFAQVVEDALDRAEIQIQQVKEITDRSIKISVSDTPLTPLPAQSARGNTVIGFDAAGNVTVLPIPSSLGAGDRTPFTLVAGVDFTPGVSTFVTLPRAPGVPGNLEVHFDGVPRDFNQWSVNGLTLTFTAPIPAYVTEIWGYIGTTLSTQIPPNSSVGSDQIAWANILYRAVDSVADLRLLDKNRFLRAQTSGWATVGDGGQGRYYQDTGDATSADNGGTVIVANDGARWKLIPDGMVRTSQFGCVGAGDVTAQLNNAFAWAVSGKKIWLDREIVASAAVIDGPSGMTIHSTGSISGLGSGTFDAVLTIKNGADVTVTGRLPVSGSYNANYACAVAVYTDNATSAAKMALGNIIPVGARVGWRFGLPAAPNALASEITVRDGYSYGCPSFCEAYGTQTVVNFVGAQCISDTGANPVGWNLLNRIAFRSIGAQINIIGGEVLLTDVTTGIGFSVEPIADPVNGNQYGTVSVLGAEVECASQLAVVRNPGAVGSLVAKRGGFLMTNCRGVHTQNLAPWIDASGATDFTGTIKVDASNKFFCTTPRTQANVAAANANCDVYVEDGAFGDGFVQGLSGIVSGNAHFSYRKVLDVQNAASQAFAAGVPAAVKYTVVNVTQDTARFNPTYSAGTGQITLAQPLKDVEIYASLHTTTPANRLDLAVFVNGVQQTPFPSSLGGNGWVGGKVGLGDLATGAIIAVVATQSGGASNSDGVQFEKFQIYARN